MMSLMVSVAAVSFSMIQRPPLPTLFPYTTLFRSLSAFLASLATPAPVPMAKRPALTGKARSEEHTSELQSRPHLVCRLLPEKKKPLSLGACPCLLDPAPSIFFYLAFPLQNSDYSR